jgi:osmotically-inducible protein OsmY
LVAAQPTPLKAPLIRSFLGAGLLALLTEAASRQDRSMALTTQRPDSEIKSSVIEELKWTPGINPTNIGVAVTRGTVTLSGEVESYPEKLRAEKAVLGVRGVTAIAQEVTVVSRYGMVTDIDIAREAAEAIEKAVDLPDGAIRVSVHDNVVTLSGQVPWHYQRVSASRAVRYLKGVHDVLNLVLINPTASASGIKTAIAQALIRNAVQEGKNTTVTTDAGGSVRLGGTVESWSERRQVERIAWDAPGVTAVVNNLHVKN